MAQHYQRFVVLLADQTIVLLVDVVAVIFHEVQAVTLLAVVEVGTDVVGQLTLVLLLVLVTHLLQLLLPQASIFALVDDLFPLDLVVDLVEQLHQPLGQLEQLVVVAVLGDLQRQQELEDEAPVVQDVHAFFEGKQA